LVFESLKFLSFIFQVLTILEEVLGALEDQEKLLIILRQSLLHLLEHAMLSEDVAPSKTIVYKLLEKFLKHEKFQNNEEMRQIFIVNLKTVTSKHLSYYSTYYFK
jgi:hypothetical protein